MVLNMREALSGELFDGGVERVHHAGRYNKKDARRSERPLKYPPRLRQFAIGVGSSFGDESNVDFPVFVISCRVAKIKNTNCETKPFRPIIERPIAAWFWQEVHES